MFKFYPLKKSSESRDLNEWLLLELREMGCGKARVARPVHVTCWWAQSGSPCECDVFSKLYVGHELAGLLISSKNSGIKQ